MAERPHLSLMSPIHSLALETEAGRQQASDAGLEEKRESRLAAILDLQRQQVSARVRKLGAAIGMRRRAAGWANRNPE